MTADDVYSIDKLTEEARRLAADYRAATGKTLPLSAEIAVNDAVRLMSLKAAEDAEGYDALRATADGERRVLIKGRVVFDAKKGGHRIGQLKMDQCWEETALVLMDETYTTQEIYLAARAAIEEALAKRNTNKRGAMTVNQFKVIGERVWPAD